jgi:hypothetical protein
VSRAWDEFAAAIFDIVPAGTAMLLLLLFGGLTGALWYFWPAWVPRRLPRLQRRARPEKTDKEPLRARPREAEALITAAAPAGEDNADRLAGEGRYAEAVRQRLRVTLRELVAARLVPPQPGWTAAELAAMAGGQRPAVAAPLGTATEIFAEIWYGDRPAAQAHDQQMRALTDQVRAAL